MANNSDPKALDRLVEDLRAAHGDNLASIVLYGSVAAGDQVDRRSDHNLVVVLQRVSARDLHVSQKVMRDWLKRGEPMPVYLSAEELERSADVFPIEFLQMEKARKVLFGPDPFELVEISPANLRHQTEYELRTKLIRLRRLYVPASDSVEKLLALMTDSVSSFAALFRAVLILRGQEPPVSKAESVRATMHLLNLDDSPFEKVLELRKRTSAVMTEAEANDLFSDYLMQIERVIQAVDRFE